MARRNWQADTDEVWDDLRFPFVGRNIDTAAGFIDYDYTDLGVTFAVNARYAQTEQVSMVVQLPHSWKEGSVLVPHIHWIQSAAAVPNFMIEYRAYNNGEAPPVVWQQAVLDHHAFDYVSGSLAQISSFPMIDMTDLRISCLVDVKFFRDSANASGLFAGVDPLVAGSLVKEFDIHYQIDALGSELEFIKTR